MGDAKIFLRSPLNGEFTGRYKTSDDGSVRVACVATGHPGDKELFQRIDKAMNEYKWRDEDFMLAAYPKNGTHVLWEVMNMLLRGTAEYLNLSKVDCMMDLVPISDMDADYPSPRVINSHYRYDVLPKEFRGRKTVLAIRNPKDTAVSFYHFIVNHLRENSDSEEVKGSELKLSDYLQHIMFDKDQLYGTYWDYLEYMWPLAKDNPDFLVIFYEDLKKNPAKEIERLNQFMGTARSDSLIKQIANATQFDKMKECKLASKKLNTTPQAAGNQDPDHPPTYPTARAIYRKGDVGDWRNHFTDADNKEFDAFLENWSLGQEIPFQYIC